MAGGGKLLIGIGLVLIVVGALMLLLERFGFRGLPGDLRYESGSVRVYFPIVTSIVLSLLLSAALWLWGRISR